MKSINYILFDCMETLIDLTELPTLRDYAWWAFDGSGVERYWEGFEAFFEGYCHAKQVIAQRLREYKEYEIYERFYHIVSCNPKVVDENEVKRIAMCIYNNYWKTYVSKCYVRIDVRDVLESLAGKFRLGVVSNFMVMDGIEQLLKLNRIDHFFSCVITSVKEGWRKPYVEIYTAALDKMGILPEETVFIGDDLENDYLAPQGLGMKTILLDRNDKYPDIPDRVKDFYEILERLERD